LGSQLRKSILLAIDSSVLVRYFINDSPAQSRAATRLLEQDCSETAPAYLSLGALLETIWVLRSSYNVSPADVAQIVTRLLDAKQLVVAQRAVVLRALDTSGQGLADAIIHELGREAGCEETITFDRRFARLPLPGVRLLEA
jgi:predicted nucleic-acid-binding protein